MDAILNNWLMVAVVLPFVVGMFKAEIGRLITAYNVYRLRAFDLDGNPSTSDEVQILNEGKGEWDYATIRYEFCLGAKKRGVYIRYRDGGKEKVSLVDWAGMRKRQPPARMPGTKQGA